MALALAALVTATLLSGCLAADQSSVYSALSHDRSANRVSGLAFDGKTRNDAQSHASSMANRYTLYHSQLSLSPGQCGKGENVGYGSSVDQIEKAFMASPHHRANILNRNYDHVGVGVVRAKGYVWVVQQFVDYC